MTYCLVVVPSTVFFFFFNDTATTEIYTLSLHDALPISQVVESLAAGVVGDVTQVFLDAQQLVVLGDAVRTAQRAGLDLARSEEHTSELQSRLHLVCRLLLEKKKHINLSICDAPHVDKSH